MAGGSHHSKSGGTAQLKAQKANQLAKGLPPPPKIGLRAAVNALHKSSPKIARAPPQSYMVTFLVYVGSLL